MWCGENILVYRWELFGGRGWPKDLWSPEFQKRPGTSTMTLICKMTKPLWIIGKTIIEDSILCVLKGLIGMFERGVYVSASENKRRYLTTEMYEYKIIAHCKIKNRRAWLLLRKLEGSWLLCVWCKRFKLQHDNDACILWAHGLWRSKGGISISILNSILTSKIQLWILNL